MVSGYLDGEICILGQVKSIGNGMSMEAKIIMRNMWEKSKTANQMAMAHPLFQMVRSISGIISREKNGQGTLTMPDGREYVGKYKGGEPDGQGVLTYADGEKFVGEYKNGKTWNGTLYNNRGNIVGKDVNGEAL
jgi:hypothetical protein